MSKVISSIGVSFYIGYSATYGRIPPMENFKHLPQVFESSELDPDPDTFETTSYDNLRYKSYADDLIDTSGVKYLYANATDDEAAEKIWNEMVGFDESGYQVWLCIYIPDKSTSTYIPISPVDTKSYSLKVNDKIATKLKYVIAGDMEKSASIKRSWESRSIYPVSYINNGQQLTSELQITATAVNCLFNNIFTMKGD